MAVGGSAAQSGSTDGEAERHLLEGELQEVECTLLGEMQQIERLAEENNEKVCPDVFAAILLRETCRLLRAAGTYKAADRITAVRVCMSFSAGATWNSSGSKHSRLALTGNPNQCEVTTINPTL